MKKFLIVVAVSLCLCSEAAVACIGTPGTTYTPAQTFTMVQGAINSLTAGQSVVLCTNTTWQLSSQYGPLRANKYVDLTSIYTDGFPHDNSRALFQIVDSAMGNAFRSDESDTSSGVLKAADDFQLRNVRFDGGLRQFGVCPNPGCWGENALVQMGGATSGQIIDSVEVLNSRVPASVALVRFTTPAEFPYSNGCIHAQATNNTIGSAGDSTIEYRSDGLRLQCAAVEAYFNDIYDVTDVGIAIFGSPGTSSTDRSKVHDNTIRTTAPTWRKFDTIGGISMVDFWGGDPGNCATYDGNMQYLDVYNNTVSGVVNDSVFRGNGYIKEGMAMGRKFFCSEFDCGGDFYVYGAKVYGNTLTGTMGYGFVIDGVHTWYFDSTNTTTAAHIGTPAVASGRCVFSTDQCSVFPVVTGYAVHAGPHANFVSTPKSGYVSGCMHGLDITR